jgi:hypothetical protein
MRDAEIDTWSRWALPARVERVKRCAGATKDDWRWRARDPQEARDARAFCQGTSIALEGAARAAERAAIEVAIIQHLWPGRLDAVLRPSLRWKG